MSDPTTAAGAELPPPFGLFQSKTVLALIAAIIAAKLPMIIAWLGIPAADQPAFTQAIQDLGAPLLIALGIYFRAVASRKITHVVTPPPAVAKTLITLALAMVMFPAMLGLAGCATTPAVALTEAQVANGSWVALDVVSKALDALAVSGALHGPPAQTAHDDLAKATAALTAADNARVAGDNATVAANTAAAAALIVTLDGIAGVPAK